MELWNSGTGSGTKPLFQCPSVALFQSSSIHGMLVTSTSPVVLRFQGSMVRHVKGPPHVGTGLDPRYHPACPPDRPPWADSQERTALQGHARAPFWRGTRHQEPGTRLGVTCFLVLP